MSAACTQRASPLPPWVSLQLLIAPPRSLVQEGRGRLVDALSRGSTERRKMTLLSISVYLPHDYHPTCVISLIILKVSRTIDERGQKQLSHPFP
jgi:hypothetical protein